MSADDGRAGTERTASPPAADVGSEGGGLPLAVLVGSPSDDPVEAAPPSSRDVRPCATCRNAGTVEVRLTPQDVRHKLCPSCGGASNPALIEEMERMRAERRERDADERERFERERRRRSAEHKRERAARKRNARARAKRRGR